MKKVNDFKKKLARVISTLFVPPIFNVFIFAYAAYYFRLNESSKSIVVLVSLMNGFILPAIVFYALMKLKKVSDIDASVQKERSLGFVIGIFLCVTSIIVLYAFNTNLIIISLWVCYLSNIVMILLVNKFWKVSAHAIGVSIAIGIMIYLNSMLVFPLILLLVIIAWSRLELKVHTFMQVILGGIQGTAVTYLTLLLINN
ncbi:MAG: hypothetical protein PVH88_12735 [Ignavibacteria bacterium]